MSEENNIETGTTLYDINKQGFEQVLPINQEDYINKLQKIEDWFTNKEYCMLLSNEARDYTVFNFKNDKATITEARLALEDCFKGRGTVMDIIFEEPTNMWEIWMKENNEVFMYYLFECRDFIIEVGVD